MKKYDLRPKYTRKIKNQAYKRIEENVKPNLVNRQFNTEAPNKIWTTDITYLILNGGVFFYGKKRSKIYGI